MGKMREEYMKQLATGSIGGDEDYLYDQYILQEKMNEIYWAWRNNPDDKKVIFSDDVHRDKPHSIFPEGMEYDDEYYKSTYFPTKDEEDENFIQTLNN